MYSRTVAIPEPCYREFTAQDLPAVKSLHKMVFPVQYGEEFYDSLLNNPFRHTILATLPSSNEMGYIVVGVLTYRIKKQKRSTQRITEWWNGFHGKSHAYMMTFGVAPTFRKRGIGTFLLQKMIDQLQKCGVCEVSLHVLRSNQNATKFYSHHGFETICALSEYYNIPDDPGDAFWMRRDLLKAAQIYEPPIFEHSVRSGPWPFGLYFETFMVATLVVASAISLLITAFLHSAF
jgi:ribosomal protein S18 acetylase RimI-like enzyme